MGASPGVDQIVPRLREATGGGHARHIPAISS